MKQILTRSRSSRMMLRGASSTILFMKLKKCLAASSISHESFGRRLEAFLRLQRQHVASRLLLQFNGHEPVLESVDYKAFRNFDRLQRNFLGCRTARALLAQTVISSALYVDEETAVE